MGDPAAQELLFSVESGRVHTCVQPVRAALYGCWPLMKSAGWLLNHVITTQRCLRPPAPVAFDGSVGRRSRGRVRLDFFA